MEVVKATEIIQSKQSTEAEQKYSIFQRAPTGMGTDPG